MQSYVMHAQRTSTPGQTAAGGPGGYPVCGWTYRLPHLGPFVVHSAFHFSEGSFDEVIACMILQTKYQSARSYPDGRLGSGLSLAQPHNSSSRRYCLMPGCCIKLYLVSESADFNLRGCLTFGRRLLGLRVVVVVAMAMAAGAASPSRNQIWSTPQAKVAESIFAIQGHIWGVCKGFGKTTTQLSRCCCVSAKDLSSSTVLIRSWDIGVLSVGLGESDC